ncbi:arylsulfatase [Aspergillus carlsbadensis]|nr:arylsulfatase [Aspergillus carlsbadensis]
MQGVRISAVFLALVAFAAAQQEVLGDTSRRPNIVFILTDDQDVHLNSLDYMPLVQKHLRDQGTYFNKHYCTTAVCCPSRVTLWTGKAAHNTNITDVNPPYGGYPKFVSQGFNENYLPVWLQDAGYHTYYTGKLFNVHTVDNYNSPFAGGFTGSDFLLDPFTYNYLNSTFQRTGETPRSYEGEYVTDVLAEKAYRLLDDAVAAENPFFLTIAPSAPHANIQMSGSILDPDPVFVFDAPVSAKRHEHLFEDVVVPRGKNFNPDHPSGANWVRELEQQNKTNVDWNDHFYRQRLRALQTVDELVDGLFQRLEQHGILDNTYIVYSSDNGFHIGQHRLQPGKSCGYEEDINIPLIVRGPGVAANHSTDIVTSHTDLAPTFFSLLGIPLRDDFDGTVFPVTETELLAAHDRKHEHINVEYWGFAGGEGIFHRELHENNTYKAIRIVGSGYNLYYSIWCNNEHELYDMEVDPGQLHNLLLSTSSELASTEAHIAGLPIWKVIARLDSLLFVLKSCKGQTCRKPWQALHPNGDVETLKDALAEEFDNFYEVEQRRVEYNFCSNGYLVDAEGPMWETDGLVYRGGLTWDQWV